MHAQGRKWAPCSHVPPHVQSESTRLCFGVAFPFLCSLWNQSGFSERDRSADAEACCRPPGGLPFCGNELAALACCERRFPGARVWPLLLPRPSWGSQAPPGSVASVGRPARALLSSTSKAGRLGGTRTSHSRELEMTHPEAGSISAAL